MPPTSTHLMNWDKITYKNPPPSTIKYIGKNIIDKRFDNYKNKYNTPHIAMLDHFKNFELIDVEYNDKNPWTLDGANANQAYATHMLYQSNFANGTYRITKPGYYELQEDIVFSPDPRGDDTFMPTETQIQNGDYPTMNTSPTGYYGMGFFAAITVEAPDVIINLNNYMIKQSAMHKLQQRFFACIELASAPFTQGAGGNMNRSKGPHQFGPTPIKTANNLYICNGTLGSSSHHGIHGNNTVNAVIENLTITNFEVGAIQINGGENIIVRNIIASNGAQDVRVNFKYSQARFIQRFLKLIKDEQPSITLDLHTGVKSIDQVTDELNAAMNVVVESIKTNTDVPEDGDASIFRLNDPFDRLDGNVYGFVFAQQGPVVGPFKPVRNPDGKNNNIILHDIVIENLESNAKEVLACSSQSKDGGTDNAYGGPRVADPVGGILDMEASTNQDGTYLQNVLFNAQLICGKAINNGLSKSGTANVPNEIITWAESGITDINSIINGVDFCYVGLGDCMGHHMKGNIGVFAQGGSNLAMFDMVIKNMQNDSILGTQYGKYPGYPKGPVEQIYMGTQNSGIAVVGCENVEVCEFKIDMIGSLYGVSNGINCVGMNRNICIFNYMMQDIVCGKPSYEGESPNPVLRCNMLKIDKECFDEVSCSSMTFV